jgi:hypothetical protein
VAPAGQAVKGIALDPSDPSRLLYVATGGGSDFLRRIDVLGGTPDDLAGNLLATGDISASQGLVFVANNDVANKSVRLLAIDPGNTIPGQRSHPIAGPYDAIIWGIASDTDSVFFTVNAADGGVYRVRSSTGAVDEIASGECFPGELAIDRSRVYWVNRGRDSVGAAGACAVTAVRAIGKDGTCAGLSPCPQTLVDGPPAPSGLALSSERVYYTSETPDGGVFFTSK